LEYQSSLELDRRTFDRLRGLPLASQIVRHARQDLVRRLDGYEVEQPETFGRVIEFIEGKMMPIVVRHAVSGIASINSEDLLFEDRTALAMLIDVFSERGFHATVDVTRIGVPLRIDLKTGEIYSQEKKVFRFSVRFRNPEIRG
jgi:adenylate kinase